MSRSTDPPGEHAPGTRISHYEIVRELGRGGMGVVYEARDLKLDRRVALKTPLGAEGNTLRRFEREGRAASRLLHPHIVPVLDVFEHEDWPYLAMEFVEGEDLGRRIHDSGPFQTIDILRHAEGLADGLRMAHGKGVLHRDIKPANVLVDASGNARLTDFGLARFIPTDDPEGGDPTMSLSLTATGTQVGTMLYMSPEQMLGKPLSPASDLYSLGVVMYEMCTGRRAFPANTQGEILDKVLHHEPEAIARFNYDLPEELERIVRKTMAKRADERYQTADDLIVDLRSLRRRFESGSLQSLPPVSSTTAPAPREQRRWGLWAVVSLAIVAIAALAAWTLRPETGAPEFPLSRPLQLTSYPGWEAEPAISPDGSLVAYVADRSGSPDLWIVDSRGGEPLQLTSDAGFDRSPAWFPDGSHLAFVSNRSGSNAIWKIPRLGGNAVLLVPDADYPAISPDGTRIAYTRAEDGLIAVTPLDDPGSARTVTSAEDGLFRQVNPRWSPDGGTLCYADFRDLWLVPVDGGPARRLTTEHSVDREPIWSVDGRYVYFSSFREDTGALWEVRVSDGAVRRLTLGTGPERQPSLSRSGDRLAYSTFTEVRDIVLVDRGSGTETRVPSFGYEGNPALAPDGSAVAFTSSRRGSPDIWLQALVDGRPEGEWRRLNDQPGTFANLAVSPDGRFLAYLRVHDEQRDVWIVGTDGALPVKFTRDAGIDANPAWSPRGDRLAFVSDRAGNLDLWIAPVSEGKLSGSPVALTEGPASDLHPAWSPDGRTIAFIRDNREVWLVPADRSSAPRQLPIQAIVDSVRWEADSRVLLVAATFPAEPRGLYPVSARDGRLVGPELGVDFGDPQASGQFDVTRDGGLLAYTEERMRGDVWVAHTGSSP